MTSADQYRAKAAEFSTMSSRETSRHLQVEYAAMAEAYICLAHHAERNQKTSLVSDPPMATTPNGGR
jgi:hypothetical protein